MKGIFLTEEGKQEIKARIADLEQYAHKESDVDGIQFSSPDSFYIGERSGEILILKEILSSATILPVRQTWEDTEIANDILPISDLADYYPNGVIIKS
jgi:hypothetical protein